MLKSNRGRVKVSADRSIKERYIKKSKETERTKSRKGDACVFHREAEEERVVISKRLN